MAELDQERSELVALTLLSALQATSFFSNMVPDLVSLSDQLASRPAEAEHELREAYGIATLLSLALGGAVSVIARSPLPVVAAGGVTAVMIAAYERGVAAPGRRHLLRTGPTALPSDGYPIMRRSWEGI